MGSFWLLYLSPWIRWLFSVSEIWQSVNCQPRRDSMQSDPDMSPVGDQDGGCSQWCGLLGCKLQGHVVMFFTCVLFVVGMFECLVMCHERKRERESVCVCVCVCVCVRACVHACTHAFKIKCSVEGWLSPSNQYPLLPPHPPPPISTPLVSFCSAGQTPFPFPTLNY